MLTRVLYIWALHHPASGYVQGINDLLTPFIVVFLSEYVGKENAHQYERCATGLCRDEKARCGICTACCVRSGAGHHQLHSCDLDALQPSLFDAIEADSYWCLTKLLDGIQVQHYSSIYHGSPWPA